MATTRLIAMHIGKGKTIAQSMKKKTDYAKNPEKTEGGTLVTSYACSPETVDQEFLMMRSEYLARTGRYRDDEVIAYQLRQEAAEFLEMKDVIKVFPEKDTMGKTLLVMKKPKTTTSIRRVYLPMTVANIPNNISTKTA